MTTSGSPAVGAVIVTFRRPEVVVRTLQAVLAQSRSLGRIVVVDNDPCAAAAAALTAMSPAVHYLPLPGNQGFAAGLAAGIEWLRLHLEPKWYWLLDDDSPPDSGALAGALEAAAACTTDHTAVGVVANRGGHIVRGRVRHDLRAVPAGGPSARADFTLVDGALVAADAIAAVGTPRRDLFIMLEDIEFTTRVRLAGFGLFVRPTDGSEFLYMGAAADWRGYYQARNHLRVAIDLRQWSWLWGWFVRESGVGLFLVRDRRFTGLLFRWRGAIDAVVGRMGKRVDPAQPRLWTRSQAGVQR